MNDPRTQFGRNATATTASGAAIDQGLRQYMLGVYNYMALGVAGTGVFAMLLASNEALMLQIATTPLRWVPFVTIIGLGFIAPRVIFSGSKAAAHALFWVNAAFWGVLISTMLFAFIRADAAQEVYRAFFITASVFGAMSLYGYTAKRSLSGWGTFLFMATIGLLIAIVLNALIFQSTMFSLITSCLVVLVFSAITAYETQMVKNMYVEGAGGNDRAAIFGAYALYGSFATLFIHILNILGIMRE